MKKLTIVYTFLLSVLIGITAIAHAQTTPKKDSEPLLSPHMPIDLVADEGSYDQAAGIAVYEGNVIVTHGVSTIWADKLTIFLKDGAADHIEGIGSPVRFEYKGQVQPITGSGKKVVYSVVPKIVTLTGDARVQQGEDIVTGNQLTYDLLKEVIGGKRVKMSFLPKENK